jgi:hypothetical protein
MENLKIGDWVTWNGSMSMRRMYTGQIVEVSARTYLIVDNEWYATSEVRKDRCQKVEIEDGASEA